MLKNSLNSKNCAGKICQFLSYAPYYILGKLRELNNEETNDRVAQILNRRG